MKTQLVIIFAAAVFGGVCPVRADTVWASGDHIILDGDDYFEIWMYGDAKTAMLGGDVYKLETFDVSRFDMLGGEMDILDAHDNTIIDIYDGNLEALGASENSLVNLYAYDVMYDPTGGYYGRGEVEGIYLKDDLAFTFDLIHTDTFSHINVVPEPISLILFGLGLLFVRKRN